MPATSQAQGSPKLSLTKLDSHYYYLVAVVSLSAVISLVMTILVIRPLMGGLIHDVGEIGNKRTELAQLQKKVTGMRQLKTNYASLGDTNTRKILVAMPSDSDQSHLLAVLETVARNSGVTLNSVASAAASTGTQAAVGTTSVPGGASVQPVAVAVQGSYAAILAFIANVEKAPRLMDVTTVAFGGSGALLAQININAYYHPEGKK